MSPSSIRSGRRSRPLNDSVAVSSDGIPLAEDVERTGISSPRNQDSFVTDRIPADPAWRVLGFKSEPAFNHARRALQLVRDRVTSRDRPYPDFAAEVGLVRELAERKRQADRLEKEAPGRGAAFLEQQASLAREVRSREVTFDEVNVLVVPEWGGIKWPKSAWSYSRVKVDAIRDGTVPPAP